MPAPPVPDDDLTASARYYAHQLAAGWNPATIDITMNRALLGARRSFLHIKKEVIEITDPGAVDESRLFGDGEVVDAIGIGIAQSARDGFFSGRIYMVILHAVY